MPNPKFRSGPITFQAGEPLDKFRLVTFNEDGKVITAGKDDAPHGVVTEIAAPKSRPDERDLTLRAPSDVAVHFSGVVQVATDEKSVNIGSRLYAGENGKATTEAGSALVGWAAGSPKNGRIPVVLKLFL